MMDRDFYDLAESIFYLQKELARQTLSNYKPEVDKIIKTGIRDRQIIEHTLDALCEAAFDNDVLLLFKKLCRYYYDIDPLATVQQIQFYREMWDDQFGNE